MTQRTYKSVNITGGSGGAGSSPAYVNNFIVGDWSGPSGGEYTITILEATHDMGINPMVQVFEKVGVDFEEIEIAIEVTSIGDVIIKVTEVPDLRFEGKVLIGE